MPTPLQLTKSGSEHGHQVAVFAWAAVAQRFGFAAARDDKSYTVAGHAEATYGQSEAVADLEWFHAIPNGGTRGDDDTTRKIRGGNLKAEGVRAGVADTFLPVPRGGYHGLYIEMKKPGGKPTEEQLAFRDFVWSKGYGWMCCDTFTKAIDALESYLTQ